MIYQGFRCEQIQAEELIKSNLEDQMPFGFSGKSS